MYRHIAEVIDQYVKDLDRFSSLDLKKVSPQTAKNLEKIMLKRREVIRDSLQFFHDNGIPDRNAALIVARLIQEKTVKDITREITPEGFVIHLNAEGHVAAQARRRRGFLAALRNLFFRS